ncbi:hypothetical protein OUZ56_007711 [Daphnia magna]|uniref:Uncharacterized protein n=1 Tax=Daphnia magna TaxID=35525 RepID=A0ABR0AAT3_9CRUS|nr:hypothetical protein OUZ56_007711 [Daphnia magna]
MSAITPVPNIVSFDCSLRHRNESIKLLKCVVYRFSIAFAFLFRPPIEDIFDGYGNRLLRAWGMDQVDESSGNG